MWQISAPYPLVKTVLFIPSPSLGDLERLESTVQHHQAMDGSYITHVKKHFESRTYEGQFEFTRRKALEFKEFYRLYSQDTWQIVRHDGSVLIAQLKLNPLNLEMVRRGVIAGSNEVVPLTLTFETI